MDAMIGVLTISRRINFLQLARYCKSCEQRFRQNFRKTFDWIAFNRFFVDKHPGHRYAIAIDPSFVSKSGKHTPGISYFWSGCAQAEQFGSDFVFVTHFPSQHCAFDAMEDAGARKKLTRAIRTSFLINTCVGTCGGTEDDFEDGLIAGQDTLVGKLRIVAAVDELTTANAQWNTA